MEIGDFVFPVLFGGFILYFVSRVVRLKGFKAALFGARLERMVGELDHGGRGLMKQVIRVHVLAGGKAGQDVGIEVVSKSFASYHMLPLSLSKPDALRLAALLHDAAGDTRGGPIVR